ncbi:putative protein {ECO:0000313/EMBL:GAK97485,1} [Petrimonas mucosa]|uniref:Uncharacterized protein n=1 Tax=Petrimonas mucosa TaxID=1642646 RepID=A0A1G4G3E8_9BACT|nr:putative protein {ECO:0000313/EMBL:GAK97485,1} [Petrimonas mucosa]
MDYVCLDTSIEQLSEIEGLSNRTFNICKYNNLNNLFQILDYYNSHGHFHDIRNCGLQTNNELVQISKKYRSLHHSNNVVHIELPDLEPDSPLVELPIPEKYTHLQKMIFSNFINIKISLVLYEILWVVKFEFATGKVNHVNKIPGVSITPCSFFSQLNF